MEEYEYQFNVENNMEKLNGTSNIRNIINGFPEDYGEQAALIYGRLRGIFGEPLYETQNLENQYDYCITTTARDGKEIVLSVYSGPSGPAIGGKKGKESIEAAYQLVKLIQQADPVDYDYVGYYMDAPSKVRMGIKNGVPYSEEEELDLSEEELDKLYRQVTGIED